MKYMGNKQRIANEIIQIMLANYKGNTFVDAFCGSCAVVQDVPSNYIRVANDKNKYLIAMWRSLTICKKEFPTIINKDIYDIARDCYHRRNNLYEDDLVGWIGYMASFNGRFFDGGYSGHNVTDRNGKTRDYIKENINNIQRQLKEHDFNNITWFNTDYCDIPFIDNSLIYCDIPYRNTKQYDFSKKFDYEFFYTWCRSMRDKGHTVFVSEYDMPNDFTCIWQKEVTTAINPTKTKKSTEKLFIL